MRATAATEKFSHLLCEFFSVGLRNDFKLFSSILVFAIITRAAITSGADPRGVSWGDAPPPKTYEINFIHYDFF